MCKCLDKYGPLLGRFLLTIIFIIAGIGKITDFSGTAAFMASKEPLQLMDIFLNQHFAVIASFMASKELSIVKVLLVFTIMIEFGGALMILIGWQARWAAAALFFFVIMVTLIFHPFWSFDGQEAMQNFRDFFKNIAILGGLMYVMVHGSGPLSLGKDWCPGKSAASS